MKLVTFASNAPPVIYTVGEQGVSKEYINDLVNNPNQRFLITDVEWYNAQQYFVLLNDMTDDRVDQYHGVITTAADANSVDTFKWYRGALSTPRRNIAAISLDNDYWLTFEDPYNKPSPRTPASTLINSGELRPYRDHSDPALIDQPTDGTNEYTYPKAQRVISTFGLEIELPLYESWALDFWTRPCNNTLASTSTAYLYAY